MAGRWGRPLNPFRAVWDKVQADELYEFLLSLWKAISGLQGTPSDPTEIQAGVDADIGTSQPVAKADHTHPIDTAAPSNYVAFGGSFAEGSTSSLMRSGATNVLAPGTTPGDVLYWDGTTWVSIPASSVPGFRIPGVIGEDGEDGPMGPPGIPGPAGVVGPAGLNGLAGAQGLDGADGDDGSIGPPGAPGLPGLAGATGQQGPIGFGIDGEDGEDGYPIPGPQGPQGPAGGGGGGGSWTEVEIDFGSLPVYDAKFTITDAAITSSAVKMVLVPCGKAATGRWADDWQWDGGIFAANPGTGSAECYATFVPGPIVGKRKLQYSVA